MKLKIIQSFCDAAAGPGFAFHPADVLNVPDEKIAKRWIASGLAISLEPQTSAQAVMQKIRKAVSK